MVSDDDDGGDIRDSNTNSPSAHFEGWPGNYLTVSEDLPKKTKHQVFISPSLHEPCIRTPKWLIPGELLFLELF